MFEVIKMLDDDKNIIGYKTSGLTPELEIHLHIDKDTANKIFQKVSELDAIPDKMNGIVNTEIRSRKEKDYIVLIFPDENGRFPGNGCNPEYEKQ